MNGMGQRSRWSQVLLVWGLLLAIVGGASIARADAAADEDAAFEKKVAEDIRAENPDAVPVFAEAMAAFERKDPAAGRAGLERVIQLAPKSDHAYRRLCGVEMSTKAEAASLAHCRRALALRDAPENHSALARAMVQMPGASKVEMQNALEHAKRGLDGAPENRHALLVMVQVQIALQDMAQAKPYAARLEKAAPHDLETHMTLAYLRANEGDFDGAREALRKAKEEGLPAEPAAKFEALLDEAEHSGPGYYLGRIAWVFGLWAAGFGLLLGLGWILSQFVLRAAENMAGPGRAGAPSSLRRVYRTVIGLTCIYFYASLPIVLLGVFVAGGAVIYALVAFGYIPIKLVLIVGIVALVSFLAVLKAIWALVSPRPQEDPGEDLDLSTEPKLHALLREVADRVGTRMVDRVFVTTGTDFAVTERGGGWFKGRGGTQRCLILGAAVLEGMPIRAFKAVLAHEYGHFKNEDTAGGGFALAMQRSLITMAIALARGGAAQWYSPAWWFVRGFHSVFLRISHGASRLQEILADRWAATAYGSVAFERGLRHVIDRAVRFDAHANAALKEVVEKQVPLANFYTYAPEESASEKDLAEELEKALTRPASPYDSHPPPHQRIAWVHAMAASGEAPAPEEESGDAWELFCDRARIQERMTHRIRTSLASEGIVIPVPAA